MNSLENTSQLCYIKGASLKFIFFVLSWKFETINNVSSLLSHFRSFQDTTRSTIHVPLQEDSRGCQRQDALTIEVKFQTHHSFITLIEAHLSSNLNWTFSDRLRSTVKAANRIFIGFMSFEDITISAKGIIFLTAKCWFPLSLCLLIPMLAYPYADYPDADPDWK